MQRRGSRDGGFEIVLAQDVADTLARCEDADPTPVDEEDFAFLTGGFFDGSVRVEFVRFYELVEGIVLADIVQFLLMGAHLVMASPEAAPRPTRNDRREMSSGMPRK